MVKLLIRVSWVQIPSGPLFMIKREFRILGIDDSYRRGDKETFIIGTILRGGQLLDGIITLKAKVDGDDATENLITAIKKSRHYGQIRCIMLNGIAVGGFNIIDINQLSQKTKFPVIVVIRKMPDFRKIEKALGKIGQSEKMKLIKKAGKVYKAGKIYFQISGISKNKAEEIIKLAATHSLIPEPIRLSHLIASGIVLGENKPRA